MFKPLTDMTKTVMGLFQSVRGFTEQAGGEGFGQGLKGIVQGVFDLNIDGAMEQADAHFGGHEVTPRRLHRARAGER